jgi:hypothetical protein
MTLSKTQSIPLRYLMPAAAIHIILTTTIFLIGHFQLLPNTIDQNGIGLTFAIDGTTYQRVAGGLADELQNNGFQTWLQTRAPFHSRLYSLAFATFGKVLGHNILAAEPLNLSSAANSSIRKPAYWRRRLSACGPHL